MLILVLYLHTFIDCPSDCSDGDVQLELQHWGHDCDVYRFGLHDLVLCVPRGWTADPGHVHFMFCHSDFSDSAGGFLHTHHCELSDIELMQFRYKCGYWRATILEKHVLCEGVLRIEFINAVVEVSPRTLPIRQSPPWPALRRCQLGGQPFFHIPDDIVEDDLVISFGAQLADMVNFFKSADNMLCRDPTGCDFPATTWEHTSNSALRLISMISIAL